MLYATAEYSRGDPYGRTLRFLSKSSCLNGIDPFGRSLSITLRYLSVLYIHNISISEGEIFYGRVSRLGSASHGR